MKYIYIILIIFFQKSMYCQETLPISIWYNKTLLVNSGKILSNNIKLSSIFVDSAKKKVIPPGQLIEDSIMAVCYKGYNFQFNYKTFCNEVKIKIIPVQYKNMFHRIKFIFSNKRPTFSVHYGNCSEAIIMITYPKEKNSC